MCDEWDEMFRMTTGVKNARWSPVVREEFLNRLREIYYEIEKQHIAELKRLRREAKKETGK